VANPVNAPAVGDAIECTDWLLWSRGSGGEVAEVAFYEFTLGDYACDNGRVFECSQECSSANGPNCVSKDCTYVKPGETHESVWTLLRNPPTPVNPEVPPQVQCYNYNSAYRLWLPGDIMCYNDWMWQCAPLLTGLACGVEYPQFTNPATDAWPLYTQPAIQVPIDAPPS